jgi:hypothetical protein
MGGRLDFDFDVAEIAHRNEGSMLSSLGATRGASMKRALLATAALGTVFIGNSSSGADLGARFGAPPVAPAPAVYLDWLLYRRASGRRRG